MFYVLLTNTERDLRLAYDLFRTSSGSLDAKGFENMMTSMEEGGFIRGMDFTGGLTEFLFGKTYEKQISFDDLYKVVRGIRKDIWGREFRRIDVDGRGEISLSQLRDLLFGSEGSPCPCTNQTFSFSTYENLNSMLLQSEDVLRALKLLRDGGVLCTKRDFSRALRLLDLNSTPQAIDAMFSLFDLNQDGTIDVSEFQMVIHRRARFNSILVDHSQPVRNGAQTFFIVCSSGEPEPRKYGKLS